MIFEERCRHEGCNEIVCFIFEVGLCPQHFREHGFLESVDGIGWDPKIANPEEIRKLKQELKEYKKRKRQERLRVFEELGRRFKSENDN
jgi:hypothetical protein